MAIRQPDETQRVTHAEASTAPAPMALLQAPVDEPRPGVLVVSPQGEVDLATAQVFRQALDDAISRAERHVLVDLSGLTFCGSTGLVVLIEARRRAVGRGLGFHTAAAGRLVLRVLEITELGPTLGLRDSVEELLAELAPPESP